MKKYIIILIPLLVLITSFVTYTYLPESIASHWGFSGQADGYSSKQFGAFLMPIMIIGLTVLLKYLPKLDPKVNVEYMKKYFDTFILVFQLFIAMIYVYTLLWNFDIKLPINIFMSIGFAGLFYYVGILVENAKQNWFIGLRTPWTLSNVNVWDKTHQLGGKIYKVFAILFLVGIFSSNLFFIIMVLFFVANFYLVIYSYLEYRKEVK